MSAFTQFNHSSLLRVASYIVSGVDNKLPIYSELESVITPEFKGCVHIPRGINLGSSIEANVIRVVTE
ncbi:hypothetical protein KEJ25_07180 [Candidatus Bathyarchaeota archaeon]|nr:hypothetical protein [Candidatus Bathyarchaeota archaeon]